MQVFIWHNKFKYPIFLLLQVDAEFIANRSKLASRQPISLQYNLKATFYFMLCKAINYTYNLFVCTSQKESYAHCYLMGVIKNRVQGTFTEKYTLRKLCDRIEMS
jgi:hypothetical protein